jgi:hypothetical protein
MRPGKRWLPHGVLVLLAVIAVPAQAESPRFEITPFGGYRIGGEFDVEDAQGNDLRDADLDDETSWGVGLALYRDPNAYYELLFSRQETRFDDPDPALGSVDITTEYYHVGGALLFNEGGWLRPWLSLTLGLTRFDVEDSGSEYKFSGSLGLGWRMPVGERLSFVVGVRGYGTVIDSDTELYCNTGDGRGECLVRSSGDVVLQGEATVGVALRF